MKILVPVKRVLDPNVSVRVNAEHSDVDLSNCKMAMNPFCEIALEAALQLRERDDTVIDEIVAVSIGDKSCHEQLRTALALGADRAIHIDAQLHDSLNIAKVLNAVIAREQPQLAILGKQSIDSDNHQTGQMLAALSGFSQATCASAITPGEQGFSVECEVDGGSQTLSVTLPALITADLRLNEPRFASLPNIMKAKRKPLETLTAQALGVDLKPALEIIKIEPPTERQAGVAVSSVDELIDKLRNEAEVI
ncbi:MAG: electron transfer flavoprotein subunit beta/FixA family protein [Pseudomonadales bacterium]